MKRKYNKAIKTIAWQEGVRPEYVYTEMWKAIQFGHDNLDLSVQEFWRKIAPDGEAPTPEKFIEIYRKSSKKAKTNVNTRKYECLPCTIDMDFLKFKN